jgi:hypothetical protein
VLVLRRDPLFNQPRVRGTNADLGVVTQAWSPLGGGRVYNTGTPNPPPSRLWQQGRRRRPGQRDPVCTAASEFNGQCRGGGTQGEGTERPSRPGAVNSQDPVQGEVSRTAVDESKQAATSTTLYS